MKHSFSLLLLASVGGGVGFSAPASGDAIVHYKLDEAGGTAMDSIGGVHMTPRTQTAAEFGLVYSLPSVPAGTYGPITLTSQQASAFKTAIQGAGLGGDSQFINSTANNALNTLTGSRSITAWIKPDMLPDATTRVGRILSSHPVTIGTARTGWGYGVKEAGNQRFTTYGRKDFDQNTGTAVEANVWQHVAMTYAETTPTNANVQLYLNGNLVQTITGAPTDAANPDAIFGLFGTGSGTEAFPGTMDEVWVFNEVLSEQQIRLVATGAPIPEPSSVAALAAGGLLLLRRQRNRTV